MAADMICPGCGSPVPNECLFGMKIPGVYDGVLIWTDTRCGHSWPRFSPDPATGYSKLHDKAVEVIAGWGHDSLPAGVNPLAMGTPGDD